MVGNVCPQCGAPVNDNETECKYCGEKLQHQQQVPYPQQTANQVYSQPTVNQVPPQQQPYVQNVYVNQQPNTGIDPSWPVKSKIVAGVLGICLGGLGIHKFYMGKVGLGIIYLLLCWTYVPALIGLIEGITYLASNDYNFQVKNHVRIQ